MHFHHLKHFYLRKPKTKMHVHFIEIVNTTESTSSIVENVVLKDYEHYVRLEVIDDEKFNR